MDLDRARNDRWALVGRRVGDAEVLDPYVHSSRLGICLVDSGQFEVSVIDDVLRHLDGLFQELDVMVQVLQIIVCTQTDLATVACSYRFQSEQYRPGYHDSPLCLMLKGICHMLKKTPLLVGGFLAGYKQVDRVQVKCCFLNPILRTRSEEFD